MNNNYMKEIEQYLLQANQAIHNINVNEVNTFINILVGARETGKQVFIMGNGGSAATASHFACDFNKGASYGIEKKRFKFICLNDNVATLMAYANDIDYDDIFVEQLKNFYKPGDVVIGISGSGNSKNIIKAIQYANANEGITVALTGYDGGEIKKIASHSININVNDMQIAEDIHMMMDHLSMKVICRDKGV